MNFSNHLSIVVTKRFGYGWCPREVQGLYYVQEAQDPCKRSFPLCLHSNHQRHSQCDLQQPFCDTCSKSGRPCEGYARFPVFLNRTLQGREKRYGLEEAKIRSSQSTDRDLSQPQPMASNIEFQRGFVESRRPCDDRILVQPNETAAFDQQIISALWEKYTPSLISAQSGTHCVWLQYIINLPSRGNPLHLSLKAFAMTRVGYINKDESMVRHGNLYYGRALNAVQRSLPSEALMLQDELFAAGYVLMVYEVALPLRLPQLIRPS